jgi:hypothetical protein
VGIGESMRLKMDWFRSNILSLLRQDQGINWMNEPGAKSYSDEGNKMQKRRLVHL